jgi:hypothetical protein
MLKALAVVGTAGAMLAALSMPSLAATAKKGGGGGTAKIKVSVSPNKGAGNGGANGLVLTGNSEVYAVVQVEANPAFAGDGVTIASNQLAAKCSEVDFYTGQNGPVKYNGEIDNVILDNDGNATVFMYGEDCSAGQALVTADLETAPYYTASTWLTILPPQNTKPGVYASPNPEVVTGDTEASGNSDAYIVINVEVPSVYAEQTVEITFYQFASRCGQGDWVYSNDGTYTDTNNAFATIDDNGNASFFLFGASCASGQSLITADVLSGTHHTYTTTLTLESPRVT